MPLLRYGPLLSPGLQYASPVVVAAGARWRGRAVGGGGTVADAGCGYGFSTIMMAKAFSKARFTGYDFHEGSLAQARLHAV